MDNTRSILTAARNLIEHGWHQGALTDGHNNFCIKGAIGLCSGFYTKSAGKVALSKKLDYDTLVSDHKAMQAVAAHLPEGFDSVPVFNDNPDTTHNDVLAVLDKAISAC